MLFLIPPTSTSPWIARAPLVRLPRHADAMGHIAFARRGNAGNPVVVCLHLLKHFLFLTLGLPARGVAYCQSTLPPHEKSVMASNFWR